MKLTSIYLPTAKTLWRINERHNLPAHLILGRADNDNSQSLPAC